MALLFPLVYFAMHLLGWGALLHSLVQGVFFWFFMASFCQFRDEDVIPR